MRLLIIIAMMQMLLRADAKVNVVATLPDFGSIAEAIGGEHVKVTTIARGTEDPHFVDARPSFIRVLNQADLLIEGGAELEVGWLPRLLVGARNAKITGSGAGHLVLASAVKLIDVPTGTIDRSMGDVHPGGNPHFWLDPENGKSIARQIASALSKIDSGNAPAYASAATHFEQRIDAKIKDWSRVMEPYRGVKVITYHKSFDYFLNRFGLQIVGQLEPKPGIEPTASHIKSMVERSRKEGVKLVIMEPFRPRRNAEPAAKAIPAKLLILPDKVGAMEKATDYFSEFDLLTKLLVDSLAATQ
jgi:zinc/manganese transport system substrate-binding protein